MPYKITFTTMGSAKGYLLKAYMVEGKEIFEGEDDKYIKFVAQIR